MPERIIDPALSVLSPRRFVVAYGIERAVRTRRYGTLHEDVWVVDEEPRPARLSCLSLPGWPTRCSPVRPGRTGRPQSPSPQPTPGSTAAWHQGHACTSRRPRARPAPPA